MLRNLRIKLKVLWDKLMSPRTPQTKFINPYAMSDPVTPQYYVQPKFRDGRFILEKESPMSVEKKEEPPPAKEEKKKEPGFSRAVITVVMSDIEFISGDARRRAKRQVTDKEAYDHFREMVQKNPKLVEEFVRAPTVEPFIEKEIVISPPPLEPEVLPPIEQMPIVLQPQNDEQQKKQMSIIKSAINGWTTRKNKGNNNR